MSSAISAICGDCHYVPNGNMYTCTVCGDTITREAFEEFLTLNRMSNPDQSKEETEK